VPCTLYKHTRIDALEGRKTCRMCKVRQPFSSFRKNKNGSNGYASRCVPCDNADLRERRKRYRTTAKYRVRYRPDKVRERKLKERYGISPSDWDKLFESQGKSCAICKLSGSQRWHTDHCHKSGIVRGILCQGCNHLLGFSSDDEAVLAAAINYLRASRQPRQQISV
jgi:Recombination endonuclease VII